LNDGVLTGIFIDVKTHFVHGALLPSRFSLPQFIVLCFGGCECRINLVTVGVIIALRHIDLTQREMRVRLGDILRTLALFIQNGNSVNRDPSTFDAYSSPTNIGSSDKHCVKLCGHNIAS